nr:YdcF family protein [Nocardiopsis mwathae]
MGRRFRRYLDALGSPAADAPSPPVPAHGADLVVVLAAPNGPDGTLSPMARDRSRAAARLSAELGATLVLTGGFGAQFNTTGCPHWRHCRDWLGSQGLLPDRPVIAMETRHTYDDALFLRELARTRAVGSINLVTSDYHAERVRYVLDLVLPTARVTPVPHAELGAEAEARLWRHEAHALGKTVAATVLFGPDRLVTPLERGPDSDIAERWVPTPDGG